MTKDILICGVGGQGVVTASMLIAQAALTLEIPARTTETIGMAQRGGSVFSHVRLGSSHSPLIPKGKADLILAMEPAEAVRCLPYLRPGGTVFSGSRAVRPVTDALAGGGYSASGMLEYLAKQTELVIIPAQDSAAEPDKPVNMLLLGAAAASGKLGFSIEALEQSLRRKGGRFFNINQSALRLGAQLIEKGDTSHENE